MVPPGVVEAHQHIQLLLKRVGKTDPYENNLSSLPLDVALKTIQLHAVGRLLERDSWSKPHSVMDSVCLEIIQVDSQDKGYPTTIRLSDLFKELSPFPEKTRKKEEERHPLAPVRSVRVGYKPPSNETDDQQESRRRWIVPWYLRREYGMFERIWDDNSWEAITLHRLLKSGDKILFTTSLMNYYNQHIHTDVDLIYFDVDWLDISLEDLLHVPIIPQGSRWYSKGMTAFPQHAPRHFSPAWKKIYEAYQHDPDLLSMIYYNSLWYHSGQHIHFAFWCPVSLANSVWVEQMKRRLRSDSHQTFGEKQRIRLAGTINPKNGSLVLGYFHPYATPYLYPFVQDDTAKAWSVLLDQVGAERIDSARYNPPAPEPICEEDLIDKKHPTDRFTIPTHTAPPSEQFKELRERRIQVSIETPLTAGDMLIELAREGKLKPHQPTRTVTLWEWEVTVIAKPVAEQYRQEMVSKVLNGIYYQELGESAVLKFRTMDPPPWMKASTYHCKKGFGAFEIDVTSKEIAPGDQEQTTVVPIDVVLEILGIKELVELEWAVACEMRSHNKVADLLTFIWLNHLKRMEYTSGIVPYHKAEEILAEQLGYKPSTIRHRMKRLERIGWIVPKRTGWLVHSWAKLAETLKVRNQLVFLINHKELKSVAGLKSVLASIPGLFEEPWIKYNIAKYLGVHKNTVKNNRKGRKRTWNKTRFIKRYASEEEAREAQRTERHPVHGTPLYMCGYRDDPVRLNTGEWAHERSSAARVVDLVCGEKKQKSKRLRRRTSHLALRGSGIVDASHTYELVMDQQFDNFSAKAMPRMSSHSHQKSRGRYPDGESHDNPSSHPWNLKTVLEEYGEDESWSPDGCWDSWGSEEED